jgi:Amt family ammonium transporter
MPRWKCLPLALAALAASPLRALAQEGAPDGGPEGGAELSAAYLLIAGILVLLAVAGLAISHAGLVRAKSAGATSLRGLAVLALAGGVTWLLGYNLAYDVEIGGLLGNFHPWSPRQSDLAADQHLAGAIWFFRMAAVAMAALIVSGALAERVKLRSLLVFTVALTGVICPIEISWVWGKGFLDAAFAYKDLSGASLIHAAGGWAALAGALILGARSNRYESGRTHRMPASNLALATLGIFAVWIGWFGLNAGSLIVNGANPEEALSARLFINTNMAASAGIIAAMALTKIVYGKVDAGVVLNSAIGGLVSISAEPLAPAIWQALVIGAFGGVIVMAASPALERLRIDDAAGAIPAHLLCGIWSALIVPWSNSEASIAGQLAGIAMISVFAFTMSILAWIVLRHTLGIRISAEREQAGLDRAELGAEQAL